MKNNQRESSIELLRIISIVLIIGCHFATHGGFDFAANTITIPQLWWNLLEMGGHFGIDIFVLISGYFLSKNTNEFFNLKKILKFVGPIVLYSVVFYLCGALIGGDGFSIIGLIKSFFPILFEKWWFVSVYFVLFLLHPFINKLLYAITKRQFQFLLLLMFGMWSIIPTFTGATYECNQLIAFVFLYCIAAYIRRYNFTELFSKKTCLIWFATLTVLVYISCIVFLIIGTRYQTFNTHAQTLFGYMRVPTVLRAVFLFMYFSKLKFGSIKAINLIASTTFGIYMIHETDFVRPLLWSNNFVYQDSLLIIPISILMTLLVFTACMLIDLIRIYTIDKLYKRIIDKKGDILSTKLRSLCETLRKKIFREND